MSQWGAVSDSPIQGLPIPRPNALTKPHWDGCKNGELLVQRCNTCQRYIFTPEAACTFCFSADLSWAKSTGTGFIYSYTIVNRPQRPEYTAPYIIVIVKLDEGWHMLSNLTDCEPADVAIGQRVEVHFIDRADTKIPMFRLSNVIK